MGSNTSNLLYLITIVTFILALRFLSSPAHARRGNQIGAAGMIVAIGVTFARSGLTDYWAIVLGMLVGGGFGAVAARRVKMTAMPQMVALFNGVGGGAAALVSLAELHRILPEPGAPKVDISIAIVLSALIGAISFSGSGVAFAKLQELIGGRPITYAGQQWVNAIVFLGCLAAGIALVAGVQDEWLLWVLVGGASLFGILFVLPIGGADMPVVISLLNAFTGLAAAATGFELENNVLIVSGMLVGASGTLLTLKMGRAMNRSITNVLFGAFGKISAEAAAVAAGDGGGSVRSATAEDVAVMLAYANKVVFVPGYGLAVAQAQHDVRQLADLLESKGVEVSYAIHPVAGRMPGHMNVLLAEANVPVSAAEGDGRSQSRVLADRRRGRRRRERRGQSRRAEQQGQPDLRHADPERRQRAGGCRPEAFDESRLRGHREPALLQPQDRHALRRRKGVDRPADPGRQGRLSSACSVARVAGAMSRAASSSGENHPTACVSSSLGAGSPSTSVASYTVTT